MSERISHREQWLKDYFKDGFECTTASADASFRSYYRITKGSDTFILMDAPPEHEDCRPFVDITHRLQTTGVNVPEIFHQDLSHGFLLIGDLGDDTYLPNLSSTTVDDLYKKAIDALIKIQVNADAMGLPVYDEPMLRREMDLFPDWLLSKKLNITLSENDRAELSGIYDLLVSNALEQPQTFVHRDYHSRNLMISKSNTPGIIDYQDAVLGPITYDLVSLLKDCYVAWPRENVDVWINYFLQKMKLMDISLIPDDNRFARWFDLMGVQRHLKASGIFARLSLRDGKDGYLKDIPRTLNYIVALEPAYSELGFLGQLIREEVLPKLDSM